MLAAAIARLLDAEVTGLTFAAPGATGGNVFVGWMPDSPDRAVAVMPGAPLPQTSKLPSDIPTMQLIVRDGVGQFGAAHELAESCRSALDCLPAQTLAAGTDDEVYVIGSTADQSGPVAMGRDVKDRPEFSLNFTIERPKTEEPVGKLKGKTPVIVGGKP